MGTLPGCQNQAQYRHESGGGLAVVWAVCPGRMSERLLCRHGQISPRAGQSMKRLNSVRWRRVHNHKDIMHRNTKPHCISLLYDQWLKEFLWHNVDLNPGNCFGVEKQSQRAAVLVRSAQVKQLKGGRLNSGL
jgi:hypothetical protein